MNKQISFQQYRAIDLAIMAILLTVSQVLISLSAAYWFKWELYILSPVAILTTLVMMRWGVWAAIHAAWGGILYSLMAGGSWQHDLIYGLGNLVSMAALLILKLYGKERVRQSAFLTVCFALSVQLSMLLGRAGVALILGYTPDEALGFITTDLLSALFTAIVAWIARRVDGLFEDQKHYLLRIQEEKNQ